MLPVIVLDKKVSFRITDQLHRCYLKILPRHIPFDQSLRICQLERSLMCVDADLHEGQLVIGRDLAAVCLILENVLNLIEEIT